MIHSAEITIRFSDIDAMGHVNNAKYLTYLEYARMKYCDYLLPDINWKEEGFIFARVELNFIQPILLRDNIVVETECTKIGQKSFNLYCRIIKIDNGKKIEMANALNVLVGYNYRTQQTIQLPEEWKKKLLS